MNQELFEKHVCNQSSHYEKYDGAMHPSYHLKLKYPLPFSVSYMFDSLHSSTNQELSEKHLCNQGSHYEKYGRFLQRKPPSCATTKLTLITVSKDEWNTNEDNCKSLKNALHVLQYAKRYLSG